MIQNEKLKRNATYAIAEVAEVALCASNCALPTSAKTGKGAISSSLFFQNSEHPRIGYFGYKKLSFDRLNVFFFF